MVQLPRIQTKYQTRLDKLLSIFEQANFVDDKKIIKQFNHEVDEQGVKTITDILHYIGTDPGEKKQIEDEQEAWRTVDAMFEEKTEKLRRELLINKKELEEKEKALEEKDKLIEELKRKLSEK